jgi:hypothetical protein
MLEISQGPRASSKPGGVRQCSSHSLLMLALTDGCTYVGRPRTAT